MSTGPAASGPPSRPRAPRGCTSRSSAATRSSGRRAGSPASTLSVPEHLLDYGTNYGPGTATHNLTLYRHASGALVFSAGTVQWSWGLDAAHDLPSSPADSRMQQSTVNLLADMGTQPATLQSGLVLASASNDHTPPSSAITSPSAGAVVVASQTIQITGTASDSLGLVSGVEVSADNGV